MAAPAVITTETAVANHALQRIGRAVISDIDTDTTKAGAAVNLIFSDTRDEVAVMLPWSSLITRTAIATGAAADSAFAYKQTLADTVLRVINLTDISGTEKAGWRREGTTLYYDLASGYIRHIQRETTVVTWQPLFLAAFTARLAAKTAFLLSGDKDLWLGMQQEYVSIMHTAVLIKAVEEHEDNMRIVAQLDSQLARFFAAQGRRIVE